MDKYLINFLEIINDLLPIRKRKSGRKSFLFQGMKWLRDIHESFVVWGPGVRQLALVNNQVINLQNYLSERFGDGITIVHTSINPSLLGRGNDTLLTAGRGSDPSSWIGRAADSSLSGVTFFVQVPAAIQYDPDELKAVVDFYKVPGSNYIIENI